MKLKDLIEIAKLAEDLCNDSWKLRETNSKKRANYIKDHMEKCHKLANDISSLTV